MAKHERITGLILAGGRATRMGGNDKGLIPLAGKLMVEHVLERLEPQVADILINANRNHDHYSRFDYPVISDQLENYCGPLAGMASGLQNAHTELLLTVPCDGPFVPEDLATRLLDALDTEQADISVAFDGERMQPVFALLHRDLLPSLAAFLKQGERKIDRWYAQHKTAQADFADIPETFLNVNTPEERDAVEASLMSSLHVTR